MTAKDVTILAHYNSEVARGIMHTEEWKERMQNLQYLWDREQNALTQKGNVEINPKKPYVPVNQ